MLTKIILGLIIVFIFHTIRNFLNAIIAGFITIALITGFFIYTNYYSKGELKYNITENIEIKITDKKNSIDVYVDNKKVISTSIPNIQSIYVKDIEPTSDSEVSDKLLYITYLDKNNDTKKYSVSIKDATKEELNKLKSFLDKLNDIRDLKINNKNK